MSAQGRSLLIIAIFLLVCGLAAVAAAGTVPKGQPGKGLPFLSDPIERQLNRLSLEEKIGQLFLIAADGDLESQFRTFHPGGVVLFSRHTPDLTHTMQLIERVRRSSPLLPLIAIDQEGGRVSRLPFATEIPSARTLGTLSSQSLESLGLLVGRELHALGINLNFAPVLDVDTCSSNPVIGDRSFSQDPYEVARLGRAYIQGLHRAGIAASAKHFPGHGDTLADSHVTLPQVLQPQERLDMVEILPFRAAILAETDSVMVGHVAYPALDPKENWPASLSRPIVTGILREELGYSGIILTDAMNMKAIASLLQPAEAAKAAFAAGVDIILMPEDLPAAYAALYASVQSGEIPLTRLDESVRRILQLKYRLADPRDIPFPRRLQQAVSLVGSSTHQHWLKKILRNSPPAELPEK